MNQKEIDEKDKKLLADYIVPGTVALITTLVVLAILLPFLLTR